MHEWFLESLMYAFLIFYDEQTVILFFEYYDGHANGFKIETKFLKHYS